MVVRAVVTATTGAGRVVVLTGTVVVLQLGPTGPQLGPKQKGSTWQGPRVGRAVV